MNATLGYQLVAAALASAASDRFSYANGTVEEQDVYNVTSSSPTGSEHDVSDDGGGSSGNIAVPPPPRPTPQQTVDFTPELPPGGAYYVMADAAAATTLPWEIASGAVESENEEETMPLWVPYVAITIVMLALIAVSFARFHIVRGYQYRKRHQSSNDDRKDSSSTTFPLYGGATVPNGSAAAACRSGAVSGLSATPEYLTMFLEFSRDDNEDRRNVPQRGHRRNNGARLHSVDLTGNGNGRSTGGAPPRRPKRTRSADLQHTYSTATTVTSTLLASSKRPNGNSKRAAAVENSRRPLAYTFNANGSMVDIRCTDGERTNTFCLLGSNGGSTGNGCGGGGSMLGGTSVVASTMLAAEDEDDSVVIVVAADDYVDEYDATGSCSGNPTTVIFSERRKAPATVATYRGGEQYYSDGCGGGGRNYGYVSRPPESMTTLPSSHGASPGIATALRYAGARPASTGDEFRPTSDFRSTRI